ncbi:MAG: PAS domain S-box protein [Deltaproteobacteria bacterium]|nr:MAG: PAS domain S-box protein [Deltaproteobacteria bacterium]
MANALKSYHQEELFNRLKWLMFFRVVVITFLLTVTAVIEFREFRVFLAVSLISLYALIGATYFFTAVSALFIRRFKNLRGFAYSQLIWDVLFTTGLVYFTGGIESIFSFLYLIFIIAASIILYRRGALVTASLSSICYGALLDLQYYKIISPPYGESPSAYEGSELFFTLVINITGFYLMAWLSSYLSEQLRAAGDELRERQIDIKELEALNQKIVEGIHSGLLTIDSDGRITSFNRAAEEITSHSLAEVYRKRISSVFPGLNLYPEGKLSPLGSRQQINFQSKDGKQLYLGCSVSPLRDERGGKQGQIIIFQDLTELKKMEEEVRRSDRLATMGRLAAGMAHEIRNPLASLSGSIQVLREGLDLKDEDRHLMEIVLREANRLNSLISDFLGFARPSEKKEEKVRIQELVEETLKTFEQSPEGQRGIRIVKHFEGDPLLNADSRQLRQVFWNLLLNASQAMPNGGELTINVGADVSVGPYKGDTQYNRQKEFLKITITDTGIGISEEDLPKIFDPFFTTRDSGSGLGLTVVYKIIESHHGQIKVESTKGKGTTFTILLPRE